MINPYSAPTADIENVPVTENRPALWNPDIAANLSLFFSPAFGAFIHMKNWQSIGEPEKVESAKNWAIISLVATLCIIVLPALINNIAIQALGKIASFVLLVSWYFASARAQSKYVKTRFGKDYLQKGWSKPFFTGLLILIGYIIWGMLCGFVAGFIRGA